MATPHDALFKVFFSTPEHAADVLRSALPAAVSEHIDWSSLRTDDGTRVDASLRESRSDLLLRARTTTNESVYVHVLFEHQSTEDPWMVLRMLRYMVGLWEHLVAKGARTLPPVIPVVLHHSERGWRVPRRLSDLLAADETLRSVIAPYVPQLEVVVDDVSHLSDDDLASRMARASVRLILRALRDARSSTDLARWLLDSVGLIHAVLAADGGKRVLMMLISYLYQVGDVDEPNAFLEAIRITMGDDMKDTAMTMEKRALARGKEQGLQQGLQQAVRRQMETRFGPLDPATIERIEHATTAELERWLDRILSAASVDELMAD